MTYRHLTVVALAAAFGISSTAATLALQAQHARPAVAAPARDDDENNNDNRHDNGKHNGWYKHKHKHDGDDNQNRGNYNGNARSRSLTGTIFSINGNSLGLTLANGRQVYVNDANAVNAGRAPNLYVGETVRVYGTTAQDGTFWVNSIAQANANGQYGNGQYGNNGNCGSNYTNANVAGYETTGLDGNGNFTLVTGSLPNIGTSYVVHVTNATCIDRQIGSVGERVRVYGRFTGNNTIEAVRITG